jgi:hypothetical protein
MRSLVSIQRQKVLYRSVIKRHLHPVKISDYHKHGTSIRSKFAIVVCLLAAVGLST